MPQTVFVLHTTFALTEVLGALFRRHIPAVRIVNVADDGLLAEVRAAGGVTPGVRRRMLGYGQLAQASGADAIFNTCSSVGEVADLMRQTLDIPVVRIDERMATEAVLAGARLGVVATVPTTLEPTARLLARKAAEAGREVALDRCLVEGAFDALLSGDPVRHDELVAAEISRAARSNDAVVLAQASMARLEPSLAPTLGVPLFASPERGVLDLEEALRRSEKIQTNV